MKIKTIVFPIMVVIFLLFYTYIIILPNISTFSNRMIIYFKIGDYSMAPALLQGEKAFFNKPILSKSTSLKNGDIILYKRPSCTFSSSEYCLFYSRIMGTPGDSIEIIENKAIINGDPNIDLYNFETSSSNGISSDYPKNQVYDGQYFVLDDNRSFASDSREFGPILQENIIGVYNPFLSYPSHLGSKFWCTINFRHCAINGWGL